MNSSAGLVYACIVSDCDADAVAILDGCAVGTGITMLYLLDWHGEYATSEGSIV